MGRDAGGADLLSPDATTIRLTGLQKDLYEALSSRERLMIGGDIGAERTLPILLHLGALVLSGRVNGALMVAPSSELAMWESAIVLLTSDRRCLFRDSITLISYEKLSRKESPYQRDCWRTWDLLFLDGGERIANPSSNLAEYFVGKGKGLGLASKVRHRYIYNATPPNRARPADLWVPLRFLLDDEWPCWQHRDFRDRYLSTRQAAGAADQSTEAELRAIAEQHTYQAARRRTTPTERSGGRAQLVTTRRCGRYCKGVRLDFRTMVRELDWQLNSTFLQEYLDLVSELTTQKLHEFEQAHNANLVEYSARDHNCESLSWPDDFPPGSQRLIGAPLTLDAVRQVKRLWRETLDQAVQDAQALLGMTTADADAMQERILFERVAREFDHTHVVQAHGQPDWLRLQHLDIWLPQARIAIEFHGAQHFVPVEYFGGEASFTTQRQRDLRKQRLCEANGCRLIVVDEAYDWLTLRALLLRLIDDDREVVAGDLKALEYLGPESQLARVVQSTIENHEQMRFFYQKSDGTSAYRTITPIRFEAAGGSRCVRGYCWLRKAERLFALSRMTDVTVFSGDD